MILCDAVDQKFNRRCSKTQQVQFVECGMFERDVAKGVHFLPLWMTATKKCTKNKVDGKIRAFDSPQNLRPKLRT